MLVVCKKGASIVPLLGMLGECCCYCLCSKYESFFCLDCWLGRHNSDGDKHEVFHVKETSVFYRIKVLCRMPQLIHWNWLSLLPSEVTNFPSESEHFVNEPHIMNIELPFSQTLPYFTIGLGNWLTASSSGRHKWLSLGDLSPYYVSLGFKRVTSVQWNLLPQPIWTGEDRASHYSKNLRLLFQHIAPCPQNLHI